MLKLKSIWQMYSALASSIGNGDARDWGATGTTPVLGDAAAAVMFRGLIPDPKVSLQCPWRKGLACVTLPRGIVPPAFRFGVRYGKSWPPE